MTALWIFAGLGVALAALNLLMTLSLAGRVRVLQESGALRDPALPKVGERVNAFSTTTVKGEPVTQAIFDEGPTLVGYFSPGCSNCELVRAQLLEKPPSIPLFAFVVNDELDQLTQAVAEQLAPIARVVVSKATDAPARAFREAGYPTLIRVERGSVVASGHRLAEVLP